MRVDRRSTLIVIPLVLAAATLLTPDARADLDRVGIQGVTGFSVANLHPNDSSTIVAESQYGTHNMSDVPACSVTTLGPLDEEQGRSNPPLALYSDAPVGAVARTDWHTTGAAVMYGAIEPNFEYDVPLALKNYYGQTSLLTLFRPRDPDDQSPSEESSARINLYRTGETEPVVSHDVVLGESGYATIDLGTDAAFASVPDQFLGSIRVAPSDEIAVSSVVDVHSSKRAAYSVSGRPAGGTDRRLFVPLFRREWFGNTGIGVINSGAGPSDVTVTYRGTGGDCAGQTFVHGPVEIPRFSSAVFYSGPGDVAVTGESPLPDRCYGTATITSDGGPIRAFVNDAAGTGAVVKTSAAYPAQSAADASTQVLVPLWRSRHTAAYRNTTGIQVMNVSGQPAELSIDFKLPDGSSIPGCADDVRTVAAGDGTTWWPPTTECLHGHEDSFGWARVESDQPVIAIVNDTSATGVIDTATYNGLACRADGPKLVAIP